MTSFYKKLGGQIRHYRTLSGLSLEELGKRIGVGKSTVRKYEVGLIKVSHHRLEQISNALGIDVSLLYEKELGNEIVEIPVYNYISYVNGSVTFGTATDYIRSPKDWTNSGIYFYLIAKGDGMTGTKIHEGDLLLIQKHIDVENGEIGVIVIDNECVLKRVYKNEKFFTLVSENPSYPPIKFNPRTDQNIKVIGKLKKAITQF